MMKRLDVQKIIKEMAEKGYTSKEIAREIETQQLILYAEARREFYNELKQHWKDVYHIENI